MIDVDLFIHGKKWLLAPGTIFLPKGDRAGSVIIILSVSFSVSPEWGELGCGMNWGSAEN